MAAAYLNEFASKQGLPQEMFAHESQSITVNLSNNRLLAINKLAESRRLTCRDTVNRRLENTQQSSKRIFPPDVSAFQLTQAVKVGHLSFEWCGMLDHERCKAHYRRGVAFENLADYQDRSYGPMLQRLPENLPPTGSEKSPVASEDFLDEAVADYILALVLNRKDPKYSTR